MNHEAKSLDLQVNWMKTKIQTFNASFHPGSLVPIIGDSVKVIEFFTYIAVDSRNIR